MQRGAKCPGAVSFVWLARGPARVVWFARTRAFRLARARTRALRPLGSRARRRGGWMTAGARITDAVSHFRSRGNLKSAVKLVRTRVPERHRWRAAVSALT